MTETLLGLVPTYGATLLALITFLSCLAVPMPASLAMLAAGAFSATGDLNIYGVSAAAFAGGIAGDQVGFAFGARIERRFSANAKAVALLAKARDLIGKRPGLSVYLTRWLLSPLGPYANVAAGAAQVPWHRFTLWGIAGEATWVAIYVGLGYAFGTQYEQIAGLTSNLTGFLVGTLVAVLILRRGFSGRSKGNPTPHVR